MLTLNAVTYAYEGKQPLRYQFQVSPGQPLVVRGESGRGKTTLFNLIAGFLIPDSGDIMWHEKSLNPLKTKERPVSYAMQEGVLFEHLSVQDNLLLSRAPLEESLKISQDLGLEKCWRQKGHALSGGQKQRVLLGQALLQRRSILLLDEPFKGLDAQSKKQVIQVIKGYTTPDQVLCVISHDAEDVALLKATQLAI